MKIKDTYIEPNQNKTLPSIILKACLHHRESVIFKILNMLQLQKLQKILFKILIQKLDHLQECINFFLVNKIQKIRNCFFLTRTVFFQYKEKKQMSTEILNLLALEVLNIIDEPTNWPKLKRSYAYFKIINNFQMYTFSSQGAKKKNWRNRSSC